jgi:hypothetical protein
MSWGDGICTVEYTVDADVRNVGDRPIMISHQLIMDTVHPDFDGAQEIRDAAHDLVRDVTAEWSTSDEWKDEDDEEPSDDDDDE